MTIAGTGSEEADLRRAATDAAVPVSWLGFVPHTELPRVMLLFQTVPIVLHRRAGI